MSPRAITAMEQRDRIERPPRQLKLCPLCEIVKTWRSFYVSATGLSAYCRKCMERRRQDSTEAQPEASGSTMSLEDIPK